MKLPLVMRRLYSFILGIDDCIKKYLSQDSKAYIFYPAHQSIIALGGINLLWPLADIMLMFNNIEVLRIHKLIHKSIT